MAQSVEHAFLSDTVLDVLVEAAKSDLFTCKESGRKRFDFACDLTRDWTKAVAGQTLWKHDQDGIDKDLRTLLTDKDTSTSVYVARDSVANRARVSEVISDYRNSELRPNLAKLRVFWIPGDFDADDELARGVVRAGLRRDVGNDLLLRVVLGGLTAQDVHYFSGSGRLGFSPWLLCHLARDGFHNYTHAAKRYNIGVPSLKQELLRLEFTGMLTRERSAYSMLQVSEKGRAMLDICAHLHAYLNGRSEANAEFLYICKLLGMDFSEIIHDGQQTGFEVFTHNRERFRPAARVSNTTLMLVCLYYVSQHGDIEWPDPVRSELA